MDKKEWVKEWRPQNKHLKPFAKGQTAPAELKSAWRERKKEAKKIMDMVMSFWWMTVDELKAIADKKKWSLTVMEARLMKYVSNDKYLIEVLLDQYLEQNLCENLNLKNMDKKRVTAYWIKNKEINHQLTQKKIFPKWYVS